MSVIFLLFLLFSIIFIAVWVWYFKNDSNTHENLYKKGVEEYNNLNFKQAKHFLQELILLSPEYKDVKYMLGLSHLKLSEFQNAINCFESVIKQNPKNRDALFFMAESYFLMNSLEKAENAYEEVLKIKKDDFMSLFKLGLIAYRSKLFEKALEFFQKALQISAEDCETKFYINKCLDELCDYEDDEAVERVIAGYVNFEKNTACSIPEFNASLGKAYAKAGNINQAVEYCKKAIETNEMDAESYKILAIAKLIENDYSGAKETIMKALHLKPKNSELHNLLSYVVCYQVGNCPIKKCREKYHEMISKMLK